MTTPRGSSNATAGPIGRQPQRTPRGEMSRASILRAATRLIAEQGYRGVSLASIAEAADLTQPGLLHHFHSKSELLIALLQEQYHADGRKLYREYPLGLQLLPALRGIVHDNEGSPESVKFFAVLSAEGIAVEHPAHGFFVRRYRRIRYRMKVALTAGQKSAQIRSDVDLDVLTPIIVAVMDGLQNQWLLDPTVDMTKSFALFTELLQVALSQTEDRPAGSGD